MQQWRPELLVLHGPMMTELSRVAQDCRASRRGHPAQTISGYLPGTSRRKVCAGHSEQVNLSARYVLAVMIGARGAGCPSESFVGESLPIANGARESCAAFASWSLRLDAHRGMFDAHRGMFASTSRYLTIDKTPTGRERGGHDHERPYDCERGGRGPAVPNRSTSGRDRRAAPPHQCDALADQGTRHRSVAGCTTGGDTEPRALLDDR